MPNYVVINDKRVQIEGKITERQVSPWSGKINTGSTEFGDFAPCSIKEYSDLRGGVGVESEESDSDRLWSSTSVESTKARYITLGPLVVSAGDLATPPLQIIDFESATYVFGTSVSKYWDGSALQTADSSPLTTPTDAIVVTDTTDTYLVVCNGTSVRYATAATTWAA